MRNSIALGVGPDGKGLVGYSAMKWVSGDEFGTRLKLD